MLLRDTVLVAVLLVACASVALGVRGLKTSGFEPLGPAAFPLVLAGVIAALALALLGQTYLRSRMGKAPVASESDAFDDGPVERYPSMPFAIMGLSVAFGLAIEYLRFNFAWTAFAFLIAAMTVMTRFRLAAMPTTILVAAVSAFGCNYIFTEVLVIYLP